MANVTYRKWITYFFEISGRMIRRLPPRTLWYQKILQHNDDKFCARAFGRNDLLLFDPVALCFA